MFKISPSILSADFTNLERDIAAAVDGGADYIHVDVMDGHFVPNITIGVPVVESISRAFPDAILDVHLMIDEPNRYADAFIDAGAGILTFHVEAPGIGEVSHASDLLKHIRSRGVRPGLTIKPNTPAETIKELIPLCDLILVMTVEPGFGGQFFIDGMMEKISLTRALIDKLNPSCELEIDGGVDERNIRQTISAGANVIVMGSAVFREGEDPADRIKLLRAIGRGSN
ncbi:MAG: ribulose-phosphate 3-epimerase [Clostridiales bacterium]|jgi:ribulose-phosphate 3-epimerase|nr:ribulose-phosphate 3-epimerase [Clostridiales bacterium]